MPPRVTCIGDLALARTLYTSGSIQNQVRNDLATGNTARLNAAAATGVTTPVVSVTPQRAAQLMANNPGPYQQAARNAIASGNYAPLTVGFDPSLAAIGCGDTRGGVFCSPFQGGQTSMEYRQNHTLGLSMDYFESWSGVVARIESSWTFDELVTNTQSADWLHKTDVMRFSLGFDRPTFIPFLNKDRTFFLSLQIFDTWYLDHEGDKNTGMFVDEHNWITTFFFIGNYLRDTLKPTGFYVWENTPTRM